MWSKETLWAVQQGDSALAHAPDQTDNLDRLLLASPLLTATGWIDNLARLVNADAGDCSDVPAILHDMFAPLGFYLQQISTPTSVSGTIVTAQRRTGRRVSTIYLQCDVTPRSGTEMWQPLSFSRSGSRLYGRSAMGSKGAIAAVWAALRAADAVGLELGFDPMLVLSAEPRSSHHAGLRHLVAEGMVGNHVISLNGLRVPRVWMTGSGMLHLAVTLQAAGHAPRALSTAFDRLAVALQPSEIWPSNDGSQIRLKRAYRSASDVPGIISRLRQAIRVALLRCPGIDADIQVVGQSPPPGSAEQGTDAGRWRKALGWGFGYPPNRFRPWTGTMASSFATVHQAGVREILVGGLRRQNAGGDGSDEFTTVEDVEALARSLLAFLSDINDPPSY